MKTRAISLLFLLLPPSLHAAGRIVSPVPGVWANRQSLVVTIDDGAECFYSTVGDPMESGFAYDGPVIVEQSGDVVLRVAVVAGDAQESYEIRYTVDDAENPFGAGTAERTFLDAVSAVGAVPCSAEHPVSIPPSLSYAVGAAADDSGSPPDSGTAETSAGAPGVPGTESGFLPGTVLSVSAQNQLSRFVPCTVTDGARRWRFVVHVLGGGAGALSRVYVPFEISGWTEFRFTGKNLIWAVDDGLWSASKNPVQLDRTVPHTVFWQSVDYAPGNPVQSFVLPPKPALSADAAGGGVTFGIAGDARYRMEIASAGAPGAAGDVRGQFGSVTFDTFEGDSVRAAAEFAFYCDGVFQGTLGAPYVLDRKIPAPPAFAPSRPGLYARGSVDVALSSDEDARVFYAVEGPVPAAPDAPPPFPAASGAESADAPAEFRTYDFPVHLASGRGAAVAYKITAYAEDGVGNRSARSEYTVIIDEYNYYVSENAPDGGDGSVLHPFNSFPQAVAAANGADFSRFFVEGTLVLGADETVLSSNCAFTAVSEAHLVVPAGGALVVRGASVEFRGCMVEKERAPGAASAGSRPADSRLLVLENAAAAFDGCMVFGSFGGSGTLVTAAGAVLVAERSSFVAQGGTYTSVIAASDSKISARACQFSAVAGTGINFSVTGGLFELRDSECRVAASLGRIAEFSGTNVRLTGNTFAGEFAEKPRALNPIWKDDASLTLEDSANTVEGF